MKIVRKNKNKSTDIFSVILFIITHYSVNQAFLIDIYLLELITTHMAHYMRESF